MPSPSDYRLRVSAGTAYDAAGHVPVAVNAAAPLHLQGPGGDVWLNVRIKDGRHGGAAQSTYFDRDPHSTNKDTWGITLWFVPAKTADGGGEHKNNNGTGDNNDHISGADLQWGNDFDEPIRHLLPPGAGTGLRILKWWVDPGLDGDPFGERPFLYGAALSSFNRVYVGSVREEERSEETERSAQKPPDDKSARRDDPEIPLSDCGLWFDEGGDAAGRAWRAATGCPVDGAGKARMKWALGPEAQARWRWEAGRGYGLDFYNGFVDFEGLAVRLPGFGVPLLRFWDGRTSLRFVLRHRHTAAVYLVVVFALEYVGAGEEGGDGKEHGKEEEAGRQVDEAEMMEAARRELGDKGLDISADDVD